ncbi:putative metalloprotease CJM1_0395 family protein [Marinobacter iranensis]|uniref:putative metalloprotease CJM1_0395 family protein n=1 Tax=Marinobacter iranensis TaxID=2962607 RepID=UPI003B847939
MTATSGTGSDESGSDRPVEQASANERARPQRSSTENARGFDESELEQLTELKARDREVRAHEAAHQSVGGQYTGSISYVYQRGPDGAQYAVGGEVSIDTSPVRGDPQATIDKMRVVRAAALAPAEPSSQDRAVAAEAMQLMLQAQVELSSEPGRSDESGQSGEREREAGNESAASQPREVASAYQIISGLGTNGVTSDTGPSFQATA